MIESQEIQTDSASLFGTTANYFVVTNISIPTVVEFAGANWRLRTKIFAGFDVDFSSYGSPCTSITFEAGTNQIVEFWAGIAKAGNNAISGSIGVSAGKRIVYNEERNVDNTAAVEIFPLDLNRKIGTFHVSGLCYVNDVAKGIPLEAGLHVWENGQPLSLITQSGSIKVRSQDEGY